MLECYSVFTGYLRFFSLSFIENSLATSTAFTVTIRLRLTERNGVIWHLVNTTNNRHLILEQRLGQVKYRKRLIHSFSIMIVYLCISQFQALPPPSPTGKISKLSKSRLPGQIFWSNPKGARLLWETLFQ